MHRREWRAPAGATLIPMAPPEAAGAAIADDTFGLPIGVVP
jgi:hypothetical protein